MPTRLIGCAAVGRRHLRPDRRQQSGAGYYQLRLTPEGQDVARRVGQDLSAHHRHLLDLS
jgi:hypothetical protein